MGSFGGYRVANVKAVQRAAFAFVVGAGLGGVVVAFVGVGSSIAMVAFVEWMRELLCLHNNQT